MVRLGRVADFDPVRGTGTVVDEDGSVLAFHCAEIADGSRSIRPGTAVAYTVEFRALRLEAVGLGPGDSLS